MGDLVKSGGSGLVGLLHGKNGEISIPKPFEKDIFLFDTYVAGTTHIEGIEELEPHLNNDDRLEFFREPDNQYDKQAIVIKTANGVKIGYVPMQDSPFDGCRKAPFRKDYIKGKERLVGKKIY